MKSIFKYCIILILVFGISLLSQAQNQVRFKQLGLEQGLSNSRVTSIVQDSLGFIWVGTKNGLNRYDGTSFKVFNTINSKLSSNDISSLKIDTNGNIWVGTIGGGVNVYNPVENSFTIYKNNPDDKNSISSDDIHVIIEDTKGRIWLGTENGLNVFNPKSKSFTSYIYQVNNPQSISHNSVWSIYEQTEGIFWIGTYGGGLNKFDFNNEVFSRIVSKDHANNFEFINAITSINEDELLLGTNGNGLIKLSLNSNEVSNYLANTQYRDVTIIRTIKKDKNQIWIGTDGEGLIEIKNGGANKKRINQYKHDNRLTTSLANNTVNTIFKDNQDNIWVGTAWKGINIIDDQANDIQFYYSDGKGYDTSPILSVFKENNELWMGTDGMGLSIYNIKTNALNRYNKANNNAIGGEFIQTIKQGNKNTYWVGTFANGILLLDANKNKIKQYKREVNNIYSLPYNDVRAIVPLEDNNLWVGTWGGGLSYFNFKDQKFTTFRHNKKDGRSLPSDNVLSVLLNNDNTLWLGTFGGGLSFFNPKSNEFTNYQVNKDDDNAIGSNYIFSLIKDDKGNLWLGTKEGLSFFDVETRAFKNFVIGSGVNSNAVVGLVQDSQNNIWLSTREGVYKYDIKLERIQAFTDAEREFHIASVFKDDSGNLYFGGSTGVTAFNPKLKQAFDLPGFPVVFTDFKILNKSIYDQENIASKKHISYQDTITLTYGQRIFTFNFSALEYPFSKKTQYAVKMEGFEEEWRDIGSQNTTTFTNLSPGNYTFKVKSKGTNGLWNEEEKSEVHIAVLPPFWKTWWAYVIYFILLTSILFFVQRYYLRWSQMKNRLVLEQIQRENEDKLHKAKQRFFTNISHEIRTPLTLILGPLNHLLKSNLGIEDKKQLSAIKSNANRLLHLVNELLNFRKLEEGRVRLKVTESNIVDFVNEIFLSFSQQAIFKEINYQFKKTESSILAWFDKEQLEKVIYNLLTNAFKFSESKSTISVSVSSENNVVTILVRDSGQGIPKDKLANIFERFYQREEDASSKGFGIGLSIAKDIVELHSGKIEVKSKLNKGSDFIIRLPLGHSHFKGSEIIKGELEEDVVENYASDLEKSDYIEEKQDSTKASVLLVEDNSSLREYLKNILSKSYLVIEASNGSEGLEMATEFIPDIVISDIMMPVMDGVSLCDKLKRDIRTSHIPVILLTARTLISDKIEGLETGADDYLTKPFNETVLKIRIKNLLQNRKLLRERFLKEGLLRPKNIELKSPDEEFIAKLVAIIEENIEESEFSVDQLAKDIGMSHSNVYKKIKALTGMTIVGFVRDFRLQRAAQLLREASELSITDICFKVGYTDRRHFSQEFKKKFGKSPSVYAKEHMEA